jgi:virulence-associated protein VagC
LDVRLPEGVQKVEIRAKGKERIITPLGQTWDSFFLGGPTVSDDPLRCFPPSTQQYLATLCNPQSSSSQVQTILNVCLVAVNLLKSLEAD